MIGVQTVDSDAMARSLKAGRRVTLPDVGLFSDGTAVKLVGEETFRLAQAVVDDIIAGRHRRDLRRDQGRVPGHAQHPGAGRRAGGRRRQGLCRARSSREAAQGRDAGRDRLRRQHELRPPALRRRARRSRAKRARRCSR